VGVMRGWSFQVAAPGGLACKWGQTLPWTQQQRFFTRGDVLLQHCVKHLLPPTPAAMQRNVRASYEEDDVDRLVGYQTSGSSPRIPFAILSLYIILVSNPPWQ